MSGTSMASPHINGVVALMREANPNLTVDLIKQILLDTSVDLGDPGEVGHVEGDRQLAEVAVLVDPAA